MDDELWNDVRFQVSVLDKLRKLDEFKAAINDRIADQAPDGISAQCR